VLAVEGDAAPEAVAEEALAEATHAAPDELPLDASEPAPDQVRQMEIVVAPQTEIAADQQGDRGLAAGC